MHSVGRYRVIRRIGAGSFSTVWLAHDDALDIEVAVKVLSDNWVEHADVRQRFIDEARVLRRIQDPRIVAVHDIGRLPDGRDYFVMDHPAGGTVADLASSPLPTATVLQLGADLADAVAALHANGVLHRDLKPANLLLTGDVPPRLLLADLGTAKRLAESSGLTLAAGTPAYMAPEQARGLGLDERTDVYGVAAVCYRLLTGEVPFPGETLTDVALRSPERQPALLSDTQAVDGLDSLLRTSLSSDPDVRPPTAAALADRFRELDVSSPFPDPTSPAGLPTVTRDLSPPSRPGPRRLAAAAVLAIVVAVATWLTLSLLLPS